MASMEASPVSIDGAVETLYSMLQDDHAEMIARFAALEQKGIARFAALEQKGSPVRRTSVKFRVDGSTPRPSNLTDVHLRGVS